MGAPGPMEVVIVVAIGLIVLLPIVIGIGAVVFAISSSRRRNAPQSTKPHLMPCPDCGKEVSLKAVTCPHCGASLAEKP